MSEHDYGARLLKDGRASYRARQDYLVQVPEGRSGPWEIRKLVVEDITFAYLRLWRDGRSPGVGTFTQLVHDKRGVVMSDTLPEIDDLCHHLHHLTGDVLISGLGLGMAVRALTAVELYSQDVRSITVVEKDADVLALSGPTYRDLPNVTLINADTFDWTPAKGQRFDAAWHDIWDNMCGDNLLNMAKLRRHYQRFMRQPGMQFCWGESRTRRQLSRYA